MGLQSHLDGYQTKKRGFSLFNKEKLAKSMFGYFTNLTNRYSMDRQ